MESERSMGSKILDAGTVLALVAALVLAMGSLRSRSPRVLNLEPGENRLLSGWDSLAKGHRFGPEEAPVTIIEFGDYECPACRSYTPVLEGVMREHPAEVAVIYRHFPLPQHRNAYVAARAAECAGDQGRFREYHELLYREDMWAGNAFRRFAEEASVPDLGLFEECVGRTDPVPAIEADLSVAKGLDLPGTPTVIVNGVLWAVMPTRDELEDVVMRVRR